MEPSNYIGRAALVKSISLLIAIAFVVSGCSADKPAESCSTALQKADELLELAEDSIRLTAEATANLSNIRTDRTEGLIGSMLGLVDRADAIGPVYRKAKEDCMRA
jgi:hypothetical protein